MFLKKKKPISHEPVDAVNLDRFRSRNKKLKWWLTGIGVVVLGVAAWFGYNFYHAYQTATVENTNKTSSSILKNAVSASGPTQPINVLLIGIEGADYPGGELSDSIMVASIDPKTKTISLLSIPRDLVVSVPGYSRDKINTAHADGELSGQKGGGPALLSQVITNTFGIPIHYFIRTDFTGFSQLVDAIGGVDVNVTKAVYDPFFPNGKGGYLTVSIKTGQQHMNGQTALEFARSRETSTDFARSGRQQQIISAIKDKLLTPETLANPQKITNLLSIVGNHLLTNFSLSDINQVIALGKELTNPTVRTQVIDNSPQLGLLHDATGPGGEYILVPDLGATDYRGVQAFAEGYFAAPRITKEATTIDLQNGGVASDVVTRLQQQLQWAGFVVTITPGTNLVTSSTLVDYTGNTPDSLAFIKSAYGVTATTAEPPTGVTTNLSLTVGPDWIGIEKAAATKVVGSVTTPFNGS